jgi:hypothetical protein
MRQRYCAAVQFAGLFVLFGITCTSLSCQSDTHYGADLSKLDPSKIEKNKTTEQELVEEFGQPSATTTQGDGSQIMTWSDSRGDSHINPADGLPFVGLVTGPTSNTKVTSKSLSATIRGGVVVDYTVTQGGQTYSY